MRKEGRTGPGGGCGHAPGTRAGGLAGGAHGCVWTWGGQAKESSESEQLERWSRRFQNEETPEDQVWGDGQAPSFRLAELEMLETCWVGNACSPPTPEAGARVGRSWKEAGCMGLQWGAEVWAGGQHLGGSVYSRHLKQEHKDIYPQPDRDWTEIENHSPISLRNGEAEIVNEWKQTEFNTTFHKSL